MRISPNCGIYTACHLCSPKQLAKQVLQVRQWVRLTGKRIAKCDAQWLDCPMGPPGQIGPEFYNYLAEREDLSIQPDSNAGLLPSFDALNGPDFDTSKVCSEVRDFYEHTARYRLEAWSEAALSTRFFLWGLTTFVSRRMNQLNFPISSLELAGGMTSDVLPMVRNGGQTIYTGWLRRIAANNRVIYTGLYSVQKPPSHPNPCVKVSFPVPFGSSTVFLRPEVQHDGSFRLISSGTQFGEPGFYRMLETDPEHWHVHYIRTLREIFHVYLDRQGILRTDHSIRFMGLPVLRLHYKMERTAHNK